MVRRVIYLIVAAAVIAGCTCREDIRADLPGKVMFSFVLECTDSTTAVEGDVISDFNLYVFNMAGDVVSSGFFTGGGRLSWIYGVEKPVPYMWWQMQGGGLWSARLRSWRGCHWMSPEEG